MATTVEFAIKLDAGQSFIYNANNAGGMIDTMAATGLGTTTRAGLVAVDLELFVAGV